MLIAPRTFSDLTYFNKHTAIGRCFFKARVETQTRVRVCACARDLSGYLIVANDMDEAFKVFINRIRLIPVGAICCAPVERLEKNVNRTNRVTKQK
jgi:hypothetical protein